MQQHPLIRLAYRAALAATLITSLQASGQRLTKADMTSTLWLEKSDRQRSTAWTLLGAGAAAVTLGLLLGVGKEEGNEANNVQGIEPGMKPGTWVAAAGGASMVASIPLFVAAKKSKARGMAMALVLPPVPAVGQQPAWAWRRSAGIRVSFMLP